MPRSEFSVETQDSLACTDVTEEVRDTLGDRADGTLTLFVNHTTCALTINEAESRLLDDLETFLEDLVPDSGWAHDEIDDNADSHLRASLIGPSVTIPVVDNELQLGTWQSVLLVECDGPRTRTITVTTD